MGHESIKKGAERSCTGHSTVLSRAPRVHMATAAMGGGTAVATGDLERGAWPHPGAEVSTGGSGLRKSKPRSVSQEANTLWPAACHYRGQRLNLANKGRKQTNKQTSHIKHLFCLSMR